MGSRVQRFRHSYIQQPTISAREDLFTKNFVKSSNGREKASNLFYYDFHDSARVQICETPKETIKMRKQKLLEMRARSGQSKRKSG
jgi:hypothetical protein